RSEGRGPPVEEEWCKDETGRCKRGYGNLVERHNRWGGAVFLRGFKADKSKLQEIIERELAANRWRWWTRIRFDQSIAAVLFHLSLPADVGQGDHFALLSFSNVYQASTNPEALALLNEAIEPLYSNSEADLTKIHPPSS